MHPVENKVRAEKGVSTKITKAQKEASWRWILDADFSPDPVLACPSGCNGSSPEENVLGGSGHTLRMTLTSDSIHWCSNMGIV